MEPILPGVSCKMLLLDTFYKICYKIVAIHSILEKRPVQLPINVPNYYKMTKYTKNFDLIFHHEDDVYAKKSLSGNLQRKGWIFRISNPIFNSIRRFRYILPQSCPFFPICLNLFLPTLGLWSLDATDDTILSQNWYRWTPNAQRIPKMYNIMAIWPIDQELLSWKPIATLVWNENWWFEIYTRSVETLKNIWLPDFELKYLENEER